MTIYESSDLIRNGGWHDAISGYLTDIAADTVESHEPANYTMKSALKRIADLTGIKPYEVIYPATLIKFAARAIGIADSMLNVKETGFDVCDDDLFDRILETCKGIESIVSPSLTVIYDEQPAALEGDPDAR